MQLQWSGNSRPMPIQGIIPSNCLTYPPLGSWPPVPSLMEGCMQISIPTADMSLHSTMMHDGTRHLPPGPTAWWDGTNITRQTMITAAYGQSYTSKRDPFRNAKPMITGWQTPISRCRRRQRTPGPVSRCRSPISPMTHRNISWWSSRPGTEPMPSPTAMLWWMICSLSITIPVGSGRNIHIRSPFTSSTGRFTSWMIRQRYWRRVFSDWWILPAG